MRVALISKADSFGGGASRVAEDLADALNRRDHMAVHWVSWTKKGYTPVRRRLYGELWQRRFYRWSRGVKTWLAPDVVPFEWPNLYLQNLPANFDVVHFHDLSSAASPLTVRWFARRMPTLWTFHDCSPFTGGCLYPLGCERFKTACGRCPQHGAWPMDSRFDASALARRLRAFVLGSGLTAVAPSRWMAGMAVASGLLEHAPVVVPNGIDTQIFRPPADVAELRRHLGLPLDRPIILVSAASLGSPYKGVRFAVEALAAVADLRPLALVVGELPPGNQIIPPGIDAHMAGYVHDPRTLAGHYGAADYFLCPSVAENFPLAVLETMACGLPTIGFRTGGIPEIVEDGVNGRLVPTGEGAALGAALREAIVGGKCREWSSAAVRRIRDGYTLDHMVEGHMALYERLLQPSVPSL